MNNDIAPAREPRKRDQVTEWQSDVRKAVRAIGLHQSEIKTLIAILHHYWAHNKDKMSVRGMGNNVIPVYPGIAKIAKAASIKPRSCRYALMILRKLGILKIVGFERGGRGFSQRFLVNFNEIFNLKGLDADEIKRLRPLRKVGNKVGNKAATVADGLKSSLIGEKEGTKDNIILFRNRIKPTGGVL